MKCGSVWSRTKIVLYEDHRPGSGITSCGALEQWLRSLQLCVELPQGSLEGLPGTQLARLARLQKAIEISDRKATSVFLQTEKIGLKYQNQIVKSSKPMNVLFFFVGGYSGESQAEPGWSRQGQKLTIGSEWWNIPKYKIKNAWTVCVFVRNLVVHNAVLSACETPGCMEIGGIGDLWEAFEFRPRTEVVRYG